MERLHDTQLSHTKLLELLEYEESTGVFKLRIDHGYRKKGTIVGHESHRGYIKIYISGKQYYAHRLAYFYINGFDPVNISIDHINRDTSDNRISNLRLVSHKCNMRNKGLVINNNSGVTGVTKRKNRWVARLKNGREYKYLGSYINKIDAVRARFEEEKRLNYKNCNTSSSAYLYLKENNAIE